MSVSVWHRGGDRERIETDTCVLGAGIAGISAALALRERGIDTTVLERRTIGAGASTRNAGFLMRGAATNYAQAAAHWGRDTAKRVWRLSEENLDDLRTLGAEELPTFHRRASCLLAYDDQEAAELDRSASMLAEDGFDVGTARHGDDTLWRTHPPRVALINPDDAVCDPRDLLGMLRDRLTARVHENAEVYAIERDGDTTFVRTTGVDVSCRRVLCCLNAWAPLVLAHTSIPITPARGQMLAVRAPEDALRLDHAYYANHGSEYFRRADNETVILGGCRNRHESEETTRDDEPAGAVQADLEAFAERVFARRFPVTARWAGIMGFTPDELPLAGPLPQDDPPGLWLCAGFTGHGMSLAHRTARVTVDAMLAGTEGPFPLTRPALHSNPESAQPG